MTTSSHLLGDLTTITPEIARHVLAHFGVMDDRSAESFVTPLISAIAHADEVNRDLIATVYPGYVAAVIAAKADEIDRLREIARGDLG